MEIFSTEFIVCNLFFVYLICKCSKKLFLIPIYLTLGQQASILVDCSTSDDLHSLKNEK